MQILSVALKNFKCHHDRYFEFQLGTNAICGENGAGKTSILEAIAWTLFNHTDYNKDELIRRGAKSGQVTVCFISRQDGRTYQVERSTSSGYRIIDPAIGQNLGLSNIQEQVLPWLKEHLGLPRTMDLAKVFADMIGIPQGTFTADFLKRPKERKEVFNPILKVEEYEQTAGATLSLEKHAEAKVRELTQTIAHLREKLQDWEAWKVQQQRLASQLERDKAELAQRSSEMANLQQEKEQLEAWKRQCQSMEQTLQTLTTRMEGQRRTIDLQQQALASAEQAVQLCQTHQASHQAYLAAESTLAQLNQANQQRQHLLGQMEAEQKKLDQMSQTATRLEVQMETLKQTRSDLEQLAPLVVQQVAWEQDLQQINQRLQQIQIWQAEQKTLTKQIKKVQTNLDRLQPELLRLQGLTSQIDQIPTWEQQQQRFQEHLSRLTAARQFQADLQRLVDRPLAQWQQHHPAIPTIVTALQDLQTMMPLYAPTLDAAVTALQVGDALTSDLLAGLQTILADLDRQTSEHQLQASLQQVSQQLKVAYQYQAEFATLPSKQAQEKEWKTEIQQFQIQLTALQDQLAEESVLLAEQKQMADRLQSLNDPRGRSQLLNQTLGQEQAIQASYDQTKQAQTQVQGTIVQLTQQLQPFQDLDVQIQNQLAIRESHQTGHTLYIQHQNEANQRSQRQQALDAAQAQLTELQAQQASAQTSFTQLSQQFDPDRLPALQASYEAISAAKNQLEGSLPLKQRELNALDQHLTELAELAERCEQAQQDLAQKQTIYQFIRDARQVYKQASPRITRYYLGEISREADRLFRELMNRQNLALEWTEDYDIRIQEGGYWRTFKALSGGEQMCAALAVRLALLKVLADIDVAFFDEPTTNMDVQRRGQLAEALANLRTFRQLFVISHDDTFENLTENVVRVDRTL